MKLRFRRGLTETLRSLQIRNFRLFFGGQLISQIGNWLTLVAQSLLVLRGRRHQLHRRAVWPVANEPIAVAGVHSYAAFEGQVRAGLAYARSVPDLWVPLVMMAIVGTFAFNFSVVMPLFAKTSLHGSDTTFTILFSVISIGSLAGALITARRTAIATRDVIRGATLFGISMFAMAASPTLATSFPAAIFVGFASIVFMTASTAIVQMRSAPEMRGRVLALQAVVFLGSTPIGGPIVGIVCQAFGARMGFVVDATACLAAAAWGARGVRRAALVPNGPASLTAGTSIDRVPASI